MEEGLNLDNILGEEDINNLFVENEDSQDTPPDNNGEDDKDNKETTEVNPDSLFEDGEPESVGSEDDNEVKEDTDTDGNGTSPKKNFYSSIAEALKEEGIFPDLDDDVVTKIAAPEDFADAIEKQIQAKFDERQKRIDDALNANIEVSDVQRYERALDYLDSIQDEHISSEDEKGEQLRKQLIYQDFINRGYSKERAQREVQKSFNAGTDVDDAKEALMSNKEYFKGEYEGIIKEAQEEKKRFETQRKADAEKLKKSILENDKVFGDLAIDKTLRQKAYDNISKPVHKDAATGELMTALQKYQKENSVEFLKNVGLIFTLTDGFKNLDGLVKGKVKKEVKKGLRELENTINNTARTSDGNLRFAGGDGNSSFSSTWNLDI